MYRLMASALLCLTAVLASSEDCAADAVQGTGLLQARSRKSEDPAKLREGLAAPSKAKLIQKVEKMVDIADSNTTGNKLVWLYCCLECQEWYGSCIEWLCHDGGACECNPDFLECSNICKDQANYATACEKPPFWLE
mmetsp:Transcript_31253/g.58697  ORF Transcript_31253/g.58697 Transcript_31253/m.58697 type:complete len:137 (+) Transcript_31253:77-487(+)